MTCLMHSIFGPIVSSSDCFPSLLRSAFRILSFKSSTSGAGSSWTTSITSLCSSAFQASYSASIYNRNSSSISDQRFSNWTFKSSMIFSSSIFLSSSVIIFEALTSIVSSLTLTCSLSWLISFQRFSRSFSYFKINSTLAFISRRCF